MRSDEFSFPPARDTVLSWMITRSEKQSGTVRLPETAISVGDFERRNEAINVLTSLYPNCDIIIESRLAQNGALARHAPATETGRSNRDKVLAVIKDVAATVDGISKATGLDAKKIRGVLTAPDLEFKRERSGGVVSYQFVGTRERKRNKSAKRTAAANSEP